jgi:imidazolonepropionase-like amidohydrolase
MYRLDIMQTCAHAADARAVRNPFMTIVVFENGRLFDGHSNELVDGCRVVVEAGVIREISPGPVTFADCVRIDCQQQTLMPGLIDAHFHAYLTSADIDAIDRMPRSLLSQYGAAALRGALRRGFTTLRDACGADFGLVMALERGLIEGPRLLISGKGISQTGGHGDGRSAQREDPCGCAYCGTLSVLADGVDEVRKAVREELRKGANQIKIFASGGVTSPTDPIWMRQFTQAEIVAVVEEAATRRTYVMAHCHTSESARVCVESGVRSIEHGSEIDVATAQLIAARGCFVVPTLVVADVAREHGAAIGYRAENLAKLEGLLESMYASITTCARHGAQLGFGTDLPGNVGQHQNREFRLRARVQSSGDILRSVTSTNAALLQMEGKIGCIRPGAYADLLVVNGNPLAHADLLADPDRNISLIMAAGTIVRSSLDGARR